MREHKSRTLKVAPAAGAAAIKTASLWFPGGDTEPVVLLQCDKQKHNNPALLFRPEGGRAEERRALA